MDLETDQTTQHPVLRIMRPQRPRMRSFEQIVAGMTQLRGEQPERLGKGAVWCELTYPGAFERGVAVQVQIDPIGDDVRVLVSVAHMDEQEAYAVIGYATYHGCILELDDARSAYR